MDTLFTFIFFITFLVLLNTYFHHGGSDVDTENAHLSNLLATPYNLVTLRQVLIVVLTE